MALWTQLIWLRNGLFQKTIVLHAWDYLRVNPAGHSHLIEKILIELLQNVELEIRQVAGNYANGFNEQGLLTAKCIQKIISMIAKDPEIAYDNEMFF